MLPPIRQRDLGDECDRCPVPPECVVCRRPAYFVVPAPLCGYACLLVHQDREWRRLVAGVAS